MKILKKLLLALVIIVVGLLVIGLFLPTDFEVKRSATMKANIDYVENQITNLENMQSWSPWKDLDPDMKLTYEGEYGKVGSKSIWDGNDDVGAGSQEITKIDENSMEIELVFIRPFPDTAVTYHTWVEKDNEVVVTWEMKGKMAFPFNLMTLFKSMDEMIGNDFDKGLNMLKEKAEKAYEISNGFYISHEDFGTKSFLMKRETIGMDAMGDFFAENYPKLFEKAGMAGMQFEPKTYGLYYSWNEETMETDVAAAIAITNDNNAQEELTTVSGKCLKIEYWGGHHGSGKAHMAIDNYMKEMGLELNEVVVEKYHYNPMEETDSTKWQTDIMYMIK